MDWKRAMEEERASLMRIVALILALAALAELACKRSPAIRSLVFWILRPVEPLLCAFVTGSADAPPGPAVRAGDVRAQLMRLASRLRTLAGAVKRQVRSSFSLRDSEAGRTEPQIAGRMSRLLDAVAALDFTGPSLAPDTS